MTDGTFAKSMKKFLLSTHIGAMGLMFLLVSVTSIIVYFFDELLYIIVSCIFIADCKITNTNL